MKKSKKCVELYDNCRIVHKWTIFIFNASKIEIKEEKNQLKKY